ncbi:hypothetical protein OAO65_02725 [Flavobacteriales bacterium]|nr:hypothetical protein [Flavobacteriales bacterium]
MQRPQPRPARGLGLANGLYNGKCDEMSLVTCAEDYNAEESQWWAEVGVDTEAGKS